MKAALVDDTPPKIIIQLKDFTASVKKIKLEDIPGELREIAEANLSNVRRVILVLEE